MINADPEVILIEDDEEDVMIVKMEKSSTKRESGLNENRAVCRMCHSSPAKYTCPRCELRTCSLPCVKEHKSLSGCSGERNKLAFVDISQYNDGNLLNDYRFLEDAERRLFSNSSAPSGHRHNAQRSAPYISRRCKLLRDAAYKRGVSLRFVSSALSKSKANRSFFTINTDTIDWHIDWLFASSKTLVPDEKVPESTTLVDAARKFTNFVEHSHLRKSLEDYRAEKLDASLFLLKVDRLPANRTRYLKLKPGASIAENLKGMCLTEYPTIVIVPPAACLEREGFTLLSKKDMTHMEPSAARHVLQHYPDLNPSSDAEKDLLDPNSCLYSAHVSRSEVIREEQDSDHRSGEEIKKEEAYNLDGGRAEKLQKLMDDLKSFSNHH